MLPHEPRDLEIAAADCHGDRDTSRPSLSAQRLLRRDHAERDAAGLGELAQLEHETRLIRARGHCLREPEHIGHRCAACAPGPAGDCLRFREADLRCSHGCSRLGGLATFRRDHQEPDDRRVEDYRADGRDRQRSGREGLDARSHGVAPRLSEAETTKVTNGLGGFRGLLFFSSTRRLRLRLDARARCETDVFERRDDAQACEHAGHGAVRVRGTFDRDSARRRRRRRWRRCRAGGDRDGVFGSDRVELREPRVLGEHERDLAQQAVERNARLEGGGERRRAIRALADEGALAHGAVLDSWAARRSRLRRLAVLSRRSFAEPVAEEARNIAKAVTTTTPPTAPNSGRRAP